MELGSNQNINLKKVSGYKVTNSVTMKIIHTDKLGILLDNLVNAGSNQISGIRFGFNDSEEFQNEARKLAMQNARKKHLKNNLTSKKKN